jgi:CSLREA domain-containing protein
VRRILLVLLIVPAVLGLTALPAHAITITVDSAADPGDGVCLPTACTLREAIALANTTALADDIVFNIPGTGQHTISPMSPLPSITDPVTIDGTTDPDDDGRIELDGTNAGAGQLGLVVSGGGNGTAIRGLVINDFGEGIRLSVGGNTVQGSYIGTDETGLVAESNSIGMFVSGSGNQIGGTGAGQGNVISGNDNDGVGLPGASNTVLEGNYIGLKADGSAALANGNQGVHIHGTSTNNTIGGTSTAARNVISGNSAAGIAISSASNTGNIIRGNYIGTNPNGTEALPNNTGVRITAGSSNTIGGTAAGAGNVISGNSSWGVSVARIADPGPSDITVQGNLIGTTASGNAALGNGSDGINVSGAPNTVIGGAAGARNVISGNGQDGIDVIGIDADGTQVKGNVIGLGADGSTDVGNTGNGIFISETSSAGFLTGTAIGGTGAGEGNLVSGNSGDGIQIGISRVQNTTIQGNTVGLALDGATDRGNDGDGIDAETVGTTTVGGSTAAARNVVSGNGAIGMFLKGTATYVVQGNFIGMDAAGTTAVPNGGGGAIVSGILSTIGGTTGITVGGSCTGACNLISGNTGNGLNTGSNQTIRGNYIGTDVTGLLDRGNTGNGIATGTDNTVSTIGGTDPEARNIVSGNNSFGINWGDVGASNDVIQGNYIGVGSDGTTAVGNSNPGITLGGDNSTIGGTAAGAGNVIAFNGSGSSPGLQLLASASGNAIRGNSIYSNGGLGIDLDPVGTVNANDEDDGDTGANERQNFPALTTAQVTAGAVTVNGTLNSVPSSTFFLDFSSSPSCNAAAPNNHGEGKTYLGELTPVTTNANGDASFTFTSDGSPAVLAGEVITATATDSAGNTSEFSRCRIALGTTSPSISIQDASVAEGDAGTTTATFTVTLSAASPDTVTVDWSTADGTATSPGDYTADSGTVTFAPMDTSETIEVTVNGDTIDEGASETFTVNLSNAGGATISDGQATGTITDDDDPPSISIEDEDVTEGDSGPTPATFTVSLSTPSASTVTVDWDTSDGTATAPGDYAANSGTVTFLAGDVSEDIVVDVNGDVIEEDDETFSVDLSGATGGTIGDGEGEGTITDDDDPPMVSIGDATVAEGDTGTTLAVFAVTLSGPSQGPVTVDWATMNGTATAPSDYTSGSDTVMFASLDTAETVAVQVQGDTTVEPNEILFVDLAAPTGATIGDGQGQGTIVNDDSSPPPPQPTATCPGFESDPRPQLVGTEGPDVMTGTSAAEILCGMGANDRLRGGGGKDLVLGGGGNDRLAGQGGKDVLKGQAGKDRMNGGPGIDRCQGGPGKDVARACERGRA